MFAAENPDLSGWIYVSIVTCVGMPLSRLVKYSHVFLPHQESRVIAAKTATEKTVTKAMGGEMEDSPHKMIDEKAIKPDLQARSFQTRMVVGAILIGYGLGTCGTPVGACIVKAGSDAGRLCYTFIRNQNYNNYSIDENHLFEYESGAGTSLLIMASIMFGMKIAYYIGAVCFNFTPMDVNGTHGISIQTDKHYLKIAKPTMTLAYETKVAYILQKSQNKMSNVLIIDVRKKMHMLSTYVFFNMLDCKTQPGDDPTQGKQKHSIKQRIEANNTLRSLSVMNMPFDLQTRRFVCEKAMHKKEDRMMMIRSIFGHNQHRPILLHCDDGWLSRVSGDRLQSVYGYDNIICATLSQLKDMKFWNHNTVPVRLQ